MAGINVTRFVDVNITTKPVSQLSGTRPIVALLTTEGTASTVRTVNVNNYKTYYTEVSTPNTLKYLDIYFNNGGVQCKVYEALPLSSAGDFANALANLTKEEIVVGVVSATTMATNINTAANAYNSAANAIEQKIFLARVESSTQTFTNPSLVACKHSSIIGAEMTIGAYLSKIDVYGTETINDYAFTIEDITVSTSDDTVVGNILTNNLNGDINLAGAIRNIGGNLVNGEDIVNTYSLIILQQTVTEVLLNLLSTKIKNSRGLSQIYSALAQELENYRICGYLTTDKVYTDNTYTVTRNGVTYTIIEKGTPLVSGYAIRVLPLESLTDQERAEHKAPPVYVILADQYGIRKIEVIGEVI